MALRLARRLAWNWVSTSKQQYEHKIDLPVIFCYTAPESPHHGHGNQCAQGLEEGSIYLAIDAVADVCTDYIIENLASCKEERGEKQEHCQDVSN